MKVAFVLALLVAVAAFTGKAQSIQSHERISLDIDSVTVWLGMTKVEAAKKFADANISPVDIGDALVFEDFSLLQFRNGRLSYADRQWYRDKVSESEAVIGGLRALAEKTKSQQCSVDYSPLSAPGSSDERIFVTCGDRSVRIARSTRQGKPLFDVTESIGTVQTKN